MNILLGLLHYVFLGLLVLLLLYVLALVKQHMD